MIDDAKLTSLLGKIIGAVAALDGPETERPHAAGYIAAAAAELADIEQPQPDDAGGAA